MTDRELLELAAKAAGIVPQWRDQTLSTYRPGICDPIGWNPLIDDGDALRLAVDLGLHIRIMRRSILIEMRVLHDDIMELHGTDRRLATRRAIVRAAAEIGEATP